MQKFDIFRLDGHTLRVFLAVCETGSVSKAADAFDLNQSTISHTIDKMRRAVGDPLFVKSGRGIAPTEKALSIEPLVHKVLANLESLVSEEEYDAMKDTRAVKVGIPTPALMPRMKAAYKLLRLQSPNCRFQLHRAAPRESISEMLSLDEVDVAFAMNFRDLPVTLNSLEYCRDSLVVYYDKDIRGPVENADQFINASHAVAGFGGSSNSIVEVALNQIGLRRKIEFRAPTATTLGTFLKGTDMIATMPLGLAENAYANLAYCTPPVPLPELIYDLVWHRRFDHSGRNAWIRNVLLNAAESQPVMADGR